MQHCMISGNLRAGLAVHDRATRDRSRSEQTLVMVCICARVLSKNRDAHAWHAHMCISMECHTRARAPQRGTALVS